MTAGEPPPPAPWGLLGIAVLLLLLILATPGLLGGVGEPTAGSPGTVAVLWLDSVPGQGTHFYVEGVAHARYAEIHLATSPLPSWPVPSASSNLTWGGWVNGTDIVILATSRMANPVAVNVTAVFVDASGTTVYYLGAYAFLTTSTTVRIQSLTGGLDPGAAEYSLTSLPVPLPLLASPTGGP